MWVVTGRGHDCVDGHVYVRFYGHRNWGPGTVPVVVVLVRGSSATMKGGGVTVVTTTLTRLPVPSGRQEGYGGDGRKGTVVMMTTLKDDLRFVRSRTVVSRGRLLVR